MNPRERGIRPLFKYYDHYAMIPTTARILENDEKGDIYNLLEDGHSPDGVSYLELLARGARDADLPWSCGYVLHAYHFHHPWTHRGYILYRSAADVTAAMFTAGQNLWTHGRRGRAIYLLGRVLHVVQDIFVPHHAVVTARKGHGPFEQWISKHWRRYVVEDGGHYAWENTFSRPDGTVHTVSSQNPYDWIEAGSHLSIKWYREYFADYSGTGPRDYFPEVAALVIPNMVRYSAGFINRFFIGLTL